MSHSFCPVGYKAEVPTTPSSGSVNSPERLTELRETGLPVYKGMYVVKGTDEKLRVERYTGEVWDGPKHRGTRPVELGRVTLLVQTCSPA